MERNDYLIKKKIYKYMVTGVMTTVALQLGNVVDAMIVGNLIGIHGTAAITSGTPYVYILQAAAILLGSGGAVAMAILLGRRNTEDAGRVMGFCMFFSVLYPLIFTCLFPVLVPSFVRATGAAGQLAGMVRDMTTVYSIGMPILSFSIVMAYLMNIDNNPGLAAQMHIAANLLNLILDYLLVRFTPLGIKGAALSTILGYLLADLYYIPKYMRSRNRMVKPVFKNCFRKDLTGLIARRGFPNLAILVLTVISVSVINKSVMRAFGDGHFSAYAVINSTQLIVQMILNGVSSVIASVAGVLYGEKDYYGMRHVVSKVLRTALLVGAVITVVFLAVPQLLGILYGFHDEALAPVLYTGLRIFSLSFSFFILNAIAQNYYRTIGQTFLSTLSSAMVLVILKIPLTLSFLSAFGFTGLFVGAIISELLSFLLLNLVRILLQKAGKVPQKGFMAIPDHMSGEICDFTVTGTDENAVNVSDRIIEYLKKDDIPTDRCNALGIAAEELINNIGRYGYRDAKDKYIDVCLSKTEGSYYLRLRDDGVPFDPVRYKPPEHDKKTIGGLELIRDLAVRMEYVRVISLNNTVIEMDLGGKGNE